METEVDHSSVHINNVTHIEKRVRGHDDDDMISALPDDVLLLILQRLDLRTTVRAGAAGRRWRRLPHLITDLDIDVDTLLPHRPREDFSVDRVMAAYTDAASWFLVPPPGTQHHRKITSLRLAFYLAEGPYLRTIGDAVAATTADRVEFDIRSTYLDLIAMTISDVRESRSHRFRLGRRLTSFLSTCPATFARLTSLTLHDHFFAYTSINLASLLDACHQLQLLTLSNCRTFVMEIDAPSSPLLALELHCCTIHTVELTRVPKLERLLCDDVTSFGSILFGSVPRLGALNLSARHLDRYIENPALLPPVFSNLRDVRLCQLDNPDMAWILFLLQAAPLLNNLSIKTSPSWFTNGGLYKSRMAVETPNIEHHNLTSLEIKAYRISEDTNVQHYIRIIRKCAVCLRKIQLLESCGYLNCDGVTCSCKVKNHKRR